MRRPSRAFTLVLSLVLVALFGAGSLAFFSSHSFAWRVKVLSSRVTGEFSEIPFLQLLVWLRPGSPVYLEDLAYAKNVFAAVRNESPDPTLSARGAALFQERCSHCHGSDARGATAPNLLAALGTMTDWGFLSTVKWGRNNTAMRAQDLDDHQIWAVHRFLRDQVLAMHAAPAGRQDEVAPTFNLSAERILSADRHPEDWLTYSGNYDGHRHSALAQVNKETVQNLQVAWIAQLQTSKRPLAATPIVAGGMIFVSEAPDGVVALDAKSGRLLWRFSRPVDISSLPLCCGAFNRGVAVLGSRVYVATLDAYLIALDATTGKQVWETKVAEAHEGYSMTGAPLAVGDELVVGVAGGEFGIRGFVAAYSATDGKRVWKFDCVPASGTPEAATWGGSSLKTGGVSTWTTGAYDKEQDLVLWTTGNPWPPLNTDSREGDNLYSNSLVALERKTGKLRWHFQYTPADSHDWDAAQQPVLTRILWKGKLTPVVLQANRNAFYYAIDRRNGAFLFAKPFVKQTWASGFDPKGRPIQRPESKPSAEGNLVWPWMHGGTNWYPPSYDNRRGLHFVPTIDAATRYFKGEAKYTEGQMGLGGTTRLEYSQPISMAIKAIDGATGEVRWQTRLDRGDFHQYSRIAGLLSTGGGLVFGGFEDRLVALDADTGKELWKFRQGGLVNAPPVTFSIDGKQQIAYLSGNSLIVFALPDAR